MICILAGALACGGGGDGGQPPSSDPLFAAGMVNQVSVGQVENHESPAIAVNSVGDAAAVWAEYVGGSRMVYGSIHNGTEWVVPEALSSGLDEQSVPAIASNGTDFMAVWEYEYNIYASQYNGTGWDPETLIESGGGVAMHPQIASNGTSYAAVWFQNDGSADSIYANFHNGTAWGSEATIESGTFRAGSPRIAGLGAGYAVAWLQGDTVPDIYKSVYNGSAWGSAGKIGGPTFASWSLYARIASSGTGYAVAWVQPDSETLLSDVYAYVYNGSFGVTQRVESLDMSSVTDTPDVASNGTGFAVTWSQPGGGNQNVYAAVYSDGGWNRERAVEGGSMYGFEPVIGSDGTGYAIIWEGGSNLYYSTNANGSWGGVALLARNAGSPFIITRGTGYAAVWEQKETSASVNADIWAGLGP